MGIENASQHGVEAEHTPSSASDCGLSLSAALRCAYQDVRALLHDHLRLAALEAQRAVSNVVIMVALGTVIALLTVTGWLALVAAVVAWAVNHGASWSLAFLGAAILSVATAACAALWIKHLGSQVMFALTLRWLRPAEQSGTEPPARRDAAGS